MENKKKNKRSIADVLQNKFDFCALYVENKFKTKKITCYESGKPK